MVNWPKTLPVSQEQLVAEVKGNFAGLIMTLLLEPNDLLLAGQRPSMIQAMHSVACKFSTPVRVLLQEMISFLELLCLTFPASHEDKLFFAYLLYSSIAVLYETVTASNYKFTSFLDDPDGYCMAIKDGNIHDRVPRADFSWHWHFVSKIKTPATVGLHQAALAVPQELFHCTTILCHTMLIVSETESFLTRCGRVLVANTQCLVDGIYSKFAKADDILFTTPETDEQERGHDLEQPVEQIWLVDEVVSSLHLGWYLEGEPYPKTTSWSLPEDWSLRHWLAYDKVDDEDPVGPLPPLTSRCEVAFNIAGSIKDCFSPVVPHVLKWKGSVGDPIIAAGHSLVPLLTPASKKWFSLIALATLSIHGASADPSSSTCVTVAAWIFAILGDIPSLYVLANRPLLPGVDENPEEKIWRMAQAWGVSGGPVFAAIFTILLRAKLSKQKRQKFVVLVVTISVIGVLILQLFMRDSTWSVLDLLALCISCGALASYNILCDAKPEERQRREPVWEMAATDAHTVEVNEDTV